MYSVFFSRDVEKSLRRIPKDYQLKFKDVVSKLTVDPFALDIKKLAEESKATHRLRLGAYRIFLKIDTSRKIVGVASIVRRTTQTYK